MDRLLLTVAEAGQLLGVGRTTVYALIRARELPVVKIGAAARIPARAVREWAERAEAEAWAAR
ncbi:MAG: DNA-binding protein [Chloroflexi bacterium CFX7]|nr:DNA-binding protein [Chloroflexi bacterium CFX7]MCK6564169.1 helix-turn-helix domain-containing protein [Dehalococcoidia bacterium]RIL02157.1 MAG: transcriptional regulator [bacterium]